MGKNINLKTNDIMKTKMMLRATDSDWNKLKSKAAYEGKELREKMTELIRKEIAE